MRQKSHSTMYNGEKETETPLQLKSLWKKMSFKSVAVFDINRNDFVHCLQEKRNKTKFSSECQDISFKYNVNVLKTKAHTIKLKS